MTANADLESFPLNWSSTSAPRTPNLRGIAWAGNLLVCGFVVGLGTWSVFAKLDSAAIAPGTVEAESSRKTIQHLEGGLIKQIFVKDGDSVKAGQTLIQLEDTRPLAELQSIAGQFWDAKAREARLIAERDSSDRIVFPAEIESARNGNPSVAAILTGQQKIFETRQQVVRSQNTIIKERIGEVDKEITGLRAQESAATKRAEIIGQELAMVINLVGKGLETRTRLLSLEREMAEINGRRGDTAARISRSYQVISESQATLLKFESDRQNEIAQSLRDTQNQIFQLSERMRAVEDQLARTKIKAPEDGIVTDLRIHTSGGVIGAGEVLMDLVPRADRLIISARIRPEDIDVVHPGLSAEIHLLTYNQRKMPPLKGEIVYVSADHLADKRTGYPYYAAKIRIQDMAGTGMGGGEMEGGEMVAGMPVQALIKTGEATVAIYALRPLLDSFNRAFREGPR